MVSRSGKTKTPRTAEASYKPTERERAALERVVSKNVEAAPSLKASTQGDSVELALNHPKKEIGYARLMEALGTTDYDFMHGFLSQLANASSPGSDVNEAAINFMLSVVKGVEPRDQIEAMIAAQMAAVHTAAMTFARRLSHVETIPQQDSAERAFNKLARTFAAQMEALKRYRVGGEQKVTVQHVTVSEGGQAIVGNVTQGQAADATKKAAASPALLTNAKTAPMPPVDACREQIPVSTRRRSQKNEE
jgi:hypothetical protein